MKIKWKQENKAAIKTIEAFTFTFLGISVQPNYKTDRRGRTILRYGTSDRNDFGKQVKCSAMNNLGNAIEYAKIPGFIIIIR